MTDHLPAVWTPPEVHFRPVDLINIRALCPPTTTQFEFDRFIAMCRARGLDPRLGHAHLFIFNEGKQNRNCTIVVSESGYLAAADRCRDNRGELIYRPDSQAPRFTYDEKFKDPEINPLGIESCTVSCFKHLQGEWHEVPATVYWDERAPLVEKWERNPDNGKDEPSGKFRLDKKKTGWIRQPRTMLAKCARVAAVRYAFPDQFSGIYAEEETGAIERGKIIDLTPTEMIQVATQEERMKALGAHKAVPLDFGQGIVMVPHGLVHDRLEAHFIAHPDAADIEKFIGHNRVGIHQFLAMEDSKGDWLDLRERFLDPAKRELDRRKAEQGAE